MSEIVNKVQKVLEVIARKGREVNETKELTSLHISIPRINFNKEELLVAKW